MNSQRESVLRYRGPKAWLVRLNLLVACAALLPAFVFCCFVVFHESGKVIGDAASLPEGFAFLLLIAIAEVGYAFCVPVLLPTCFLLPALLRAQDIPFRVKRIAAFAVAAALIIMLATVTVFHFGYKEAQGKPGALFT